MPAPAISDLAGTKPSYFSSPNLDQAVSGFLGGAASTVMLHPLDLIKTRLQADLVSQPRISLSHSARMLGNIVHKFGFRGLYQGLGPNFIGATTSWGLYFWWYSQFKYQFGPGNLRPDQYLLAGALAGALTSMCTNPIWVIKTRICLDSPTHPTYRGVIHAFSHISRTEGLRGLYRGIGPALIGVSHGAVQFMVYESLKSWTYQYSASHGNQSWLLGPTSEYLANAILSKTVAAVVTYPYQVVKTRVQAESNTTVRQTILSTWHTQGWAGFYRGLGANILRVLPGSCITFVVYETASLWFKTHATCLDECT